MFTIDKKGYKTKTAMYDDIQMYSSGLLTGERDCIANMANISALLNEFLDEINWVGFYIVRDNELVLGPFQGKPACIRISKGKGVCGTAYKNGKTELVMNVHEYPGHIACDAASCSEIVVPVLYKNEVVAVLDIDSPIFDRFDDEDKNGLENLCNAISNACNW